MERDKASDRGMPRRTPCTPQAGPRRATQSQPKDAPRMHSFGAWRSLVAHLLWEQDVGGSNPLAPTTIPAARGQGQQESEGRAPAGLRLDLDPPPVSVGNLLHDRPDRHLRPPPGEIHSVGDEVCEHLLYLLGVGVHDRRVIPRLSA